MFTSYIMDKTGFTILCMLLGDKDVKIPEQFYDAVDEKNYEKVLKRLSDVGYIYISDSHTDVDTEQKHRSDGGAAEAFGGRCE